MNRTSKNQRAASVRAALAATMAACACLAATPTRADGLEGGVGIASDKVLRGLSQSGGRPSLLLDLVYRTDTRWAFGFGAASLTNNGRRNGSDSEVNVAVSRGWPLDDDWTAQLNGSYYAYPGSRDARYRAYGELGASLFWRETLSIAASLAPSISGQDRNARAQRGTTGAIEAGLHAPLGARWALDAGIGWHDVRRLGNRPYAYGSVGVSWRNGPIQVFVSRITSRADERNGVQDRVAGDRVVTSIWWLF